MLVGLDFDNTIVCYDRLFHRLARERGLIPEHVPATKGAVRDHLRNVGRERVGGGQFLCERLWSHIGPHDRDPALEWHELVAPVGDGSRKR